MSLEEVYSFTTIEGLEYRIGFSPFNSLIIPEKINKPIIDVVIATQDTNVINNAGTLFIFTKIIKEYLIKNDVLLYCYCDSIEINRGQKHQVLTPQEYRNLLFQKMFDRESDNKFVNKLIVLTDINDVNHYVMIISTISNLTLLQIAENELMKLNKP